MNADLQPIAPLEGRGRFLRVLIDFVDRCNLKCIMCYFSLPGRGDREDEISLEEFRRLAPELLPYTSHLGLSCATEPFMCRHFLEVLSLVGEHGVPFVYYITNGTLLTERAIRETIRTKVGMVSVSIDGARRETFEAIRRGARFDKVLANVRRLRDLKRETGSELPRLQFSVTLMRSNIEDLEPLMHLFKDLGGQEVDIRHAVPYEGLESCDLTLFEHKELTNRHLDRARALAAEFDLALVNCPANFDLGADPEPPPGPSLTEPCRRPWTMTLVHPDGGVIPCDNWHTHELMGNVKEQPFGEIWNGPAYRRLREELLSGRLGPTCRHCPAAGFGSVDRPESFEVRET